MTRPLSIPLITEEPVASVLRSLQLTETGDDTFSAGSLPQMRRIYGGQVVSQALVAAMATVDDSDEGAGKLPHFLHALFVRGGDPAKPFEIEVERLRDGRSFVTRSVSAGQAGREIFRMTCSFQGEEDGREFSPEPPIAPEPEGLGSNIELFRDMDNPVGRFLGKTAAFDVRHVQRNLYVGADAERRSDQQLWMRPRHDIPAGFGPGLRRALLAYVIDQYMLEPAMRATGLSWITEGLSVASLDHSMWFHRDFDINDWLLVDGHARSVNNGRALTSVDIYRADGALVASAAQQGMLRVPAEGETRESSWSMTSRA